MSNYTKTTDFEAKDSLPSGDSGKIIRGSEFETEFDNIATAIASKSDANNPTFTGTVTIDGLTVNGNTVLGNAATDTVTVTADIASNLIPSADDTYNLGASGAEWNDLFIDGTANIDSLVAGSGSFTSISTTGNVTFGDNDKAIFGAGSDLEIYHDGSGSFINDTGTGDLHIRASNTLRLQNSAGQLYAYGFNGGEFALYHNNAQKLATTATGINVTGTVVADGLTVDGGAQFNTGATGIAEFHHVSGLGGVRITGAAGGSSSTLFLSNDKQGGGDDIFALYGNGANDNLEFYSGGTAGTGTLRAQFANNGDISFYEDTGTTAKLFWDASEESLGIGTSSPTHALSVEKASSTGNLLSLYNNRNNGDSPCRILFKDKNTISGGTNAARIGSLREGTTANFSFTVETGATDTLTEAMRIDSSGNVGIGTDSPGSNLEVSSATGSASPTATELRIGSSTQASNWSLTDPWGTLGFYSADTSGGGAGNLAEISARMENTVGGFASLDFTLQNPGSSYAQTNWLSLKNAASLSQRRVDIEADGGLYVANNVGIGTDSPAKLLDVSSNSSPTIRISNTRNDSNWDTDPVFGALEFYSADGSGSGASVRASVQAEAASAFGNATDIVFRNGDSLGVQQENMRIDYQGNVGIGTSSPTQELTVAGGVYSSNQNVGADFIIGSQSGSHFKAGIAAKTDGSGVAYTALLRATDTAGNYSEAFQAFNGSLRFFPSSSEAMRLDASGNLLVGKTSTALSIAGTTLFEDGTAYHTVSGNTTMRLNRLTNDGTIVDLRKDGTTVGSIGVGSGDLHIYSGASGHKGLRFGLGYIAPTNNSGAIDDNNVDLGYGGGSPARFKDLYLSGGVKNSGSIYMGRTDLNTSVWVGNSTVNPGDSSGTVRDGAVSLGYSAGRWKDLYLSGGAYLGGTAAANKLDDYEEGTFTITNNGDATGVISSQSGTYTKVGNVVHFDCAFTVTTNFTSSSVAGLPFTPSIDSTASSLRPVSVAVNNAQDVAARVANGSTTVTFAETSNGTPHEPDTIGATYRISGSYFTAA